MSCNLHLFREMLAADSRLVEPSVNSRLSLEEQESTQVFIRIETRGANRTWFCTRHVRLIMGLQISRLASIWNVTGPQKTGFRLRVIGREHPELALSFNAVRCKVCMINGKNYRKKFTLRQIHERAIGKIHGSIPIARHQTVHMLQFRMLDCTEDQCSGIDEPPGGLHLQARIANQVE
jgi:hypothetical protein